MAKSAERCLARIELDDDVVAWLSDRPLRAHQVKRRPCCALEEKHPGPHGALGQQGDGVEWWIRWTLVASEVIETDICPVQVPAAMTGDDPTFCLLFVDHPGRHSFELEPQAGA